MHRPRKRSLRWLPCLGLAWALFLTIGGPAQALDRAPYTMQILVDGIPLEELQHHGKTYVRALENREYSVRLTNHTAQRIAVALSVDGLNSIDAKTTTAREASKWILGPYDSVVLDGWQTRSDTARRFFFTTEERSYGAWLGRTSNLGTIAAAVFREQTPVPAPRHFEEGRRDRSRRPPAPRSEAAPDKAGEAPGPATGNLKHQEQELSDDMAATGIGRELEHRVRRVHFRSEKNPVATLEVRYEYLDALVALGVLPRPRPHASPLSRRERARGFADSGFAPDPFATPRRR